MTGSSNSLVGQIYVISVRSQVTQGVTRQDREAVCLIVSRYMLNNSNRYVKDTILQHIIYIAISIEGSPWQATAR